MSIHEPTGEKPGSKGRDSPNRAPNPFAVPGALKPTAAHHVTPAVGGGDSPSPDLDWKLIADQFPFGLIVLGPGQELRHENLICRSMLGSSVGAAGGVEAWLKSLCPDADHGRRVIESFREHVWRNQLTRTFSLRTAQGKLKEIEFRSSLHRDGGLTIVLQDVTESLRAQEAQRHGKLKFRALFAGTENGAVLADRTGRIIDANPAFLELVDLSIREIRRSAFSELLHPEDALKLEEAEADFLASDGSAEAAPLKVRLRAREGEKTSPLSFKTIGETHGDPAMFLYLTGGVNSGSEALLTERLHLVARKAKSLLDAVPDLIFLIDEDLTVADFAPPPQPWKELETLDSWRGSALAAVWPALAGLLSGPRRELIQAGKTVHADIVNQTKGPSQFGVTLSSAGDGQILAVVRNDSELRRVRESGTLLNRTFDLQRRPVVLADGSGTILAANGAMRELTGQDEDRLVGNPLTVLLDDTSCMLVAQHLPAGQEAGKISAFAANVKRRELPPVARQLEICSLSDPGQPITFSLSISEGSSAAAGLSAEQTQHHFRNQLQMVTSLFSMESSGTSEGEDLIKWQLRLRSLACAIPGAAPISLVSLIRDVSDEAARLMQLGPGDRLISASGPDHLEVSAGRLTPMALLIGELIHLVISRRRTGVVPRLQFSCRGEDNGEVELSLQTSHLDSSPLADAATDTVQVLVAQLGGQLSLTGEGTSPGWTIFLPAERLD